MYGAIKTATKVILLSVLTLGIYISLFLYATDDICKNIVYKEYASPNRLLKAVVFARDCGATTGFSTQVSILDFDESLDNSSGNILLIKGEPSYVALSFKWISSSELFIDYSINGREFKAKKSYGYFNRVKIIYKN